MADAFKKGDQDMRCPFCGEGDFDAEGLKGHLLNEDCDEIRSVEARSRMFAP